MSVVDVSVFVGNGFDLKAGLKTGARDFIEHWKAELEEFDADSPEGRLRANIDEAGIDTWCDFEGQFGKYSASLENLVGADHLAAEFMRSKEILDTALRSYIMAQGSTIPDRFVEENASACINSVANWLGLLNDRDRDKLLSEMPDKPIEFRYRLLSFNYTSTLQKLVDSLEEERLTPDVPVEVSAIHSFYSCRYVHGCLEGAPICGVDNPSQIEGEIARTSARVNRVVVKSQIQDLMGSKDDQYAMEDIKTSEIIVIFGMSIGFTDKRWWTEACKRLLANSMNHVVICVKGLDDKKHNPVAYMTERDSWRDRLIYSSDMDEEQFTDSVRDRILVVPAEPVLRIPKPLVIEA